MLHTKKKDFKNRASALRFEQHQIIHTFLFKNILAKINGSVSAQFSSSHKKKILYKLLKRKAPRFKTRNVRRCVYTNRSRGVLRPFKLSRSYLRELMSFGIIPGYKKAVW